jgi:hypothetical protein
MTTLVTLVLLVLAIAATVYLFTLPDMNGFGTGKCSEKDYEIQENVSKKNNI